MLHFKRLLCLFTLLAVALSITAVAQSSRTSTGQGNSDANISVPATGGIQRVTVNTLNDAWNVDAETVPNWVTIRRNSNNSLIIEVTRNTTASQRSAKITIFIGNEERYIYITQEKRVTPSAPPPPRKKNEEKFEETKQPRQQPPMQEKPQTWLNVSPQDLYFDAAGGDITVSITSNSQCSVTPPQSNWAKVTAGYDQITISVERNKTKEYRSEYLIVTADNETVVINIHQKAGTK